MPISEPIAIIGSGCKFVGGATSPSALWSLLKDPVDLASEVPPDRFNIDAFYHTGSKRHGTTNVREAYFLSEDVRRFDASFFNISAMEAEGIDPQQRLLLETVYEAIERAGIRPTSLQGSSTGVFCGTMFDDYNQILLRDTDHAPQYTATGVARSNLSNRVSYFFDWQGPSVTLDTACSSSMIAAHLAVQSLREGGCRMAVACGTNLIMSPTFFLFASPLNMLSPTGRGKMWDISADGYARGEGIAAVVLKRLSDAIADGDHIESVIRETGVNQDGRTMGITMPSGAAQARLIRSTYEKAGLRPDTAEGRCQYFEAHGTGTQAGDPQEASAIAEVFFPQTEAKLNGIGKKKLLVGSIKTVIGHTEGAAGLAGLIKASLSIQHGLVVPNLHFETLNPKIEPYYDNICIPTIAQPWPELPEGVPRRASVNSFGFGGTNAHAILESYDGVAAKTKLNGLGAPVVNIPLPFVFSTPSDQTLVSLLQSWSQYLATHGDVDYTHLAKALFSRRDVFTHKFVTQAVSSRDLQDKIDAELARRQDKSAATSSTVRKTSPGPKRVLAVFTGQGAQWPRMGIDLLLASPHATRWLQELQDSLDSLPPQYRPRYSLAQELAAAQDSSRLREAAISQPLCTALQIIQVNLLREIGFGVSAVVGHSSGEIAAAYAAGAVCAAEAIRIAHLRGMVAKLAGSGHQLGAMAAAGLDAEEAIRLCTRPEFFGRVAVAAYNSPQSVTFSGDAPAIDELSDLLKSQQRFVRVLNVDKAYHSHHMEPCAKAYLAALQSVAIQPQTCASARWFSSLKPGHEIGHSDMKSLKASYWVDNMLEPVLFTQAIVAAAKESFPDLILEIGPHAALKGPTRLSLSESLPHANGANVPYISLLSRGESALKCFADALGSFWAIAGPGSCKLGSYVTMLGGSTSDSMTPMMKTIPTYPFDKSKAYWAESRASMSFAHRSQSVHMLLGAPTTDSPPGEWCWRNYLRPEQIPWLSGHKIESQIVFPATGYVAMAVEAAAIIADTRPLRLVQLCDFQIENAIVLKDSSSFLADVEIFFRIQNFQIDAAGSRATATFACHSTFAGKLRRCAHGSMEMTFGEQDQYLLPSRRALPHDLAEINIDELYSYLHQFGYGYEGLFRGITQCGRKRDLASGRITNVSLGNTDGSLIVHPAMMDTLLQGFLAAIGECHDGRLHTLLVPTGIARVTINPFFGGPGGIATDEVAFDAQLTGSDAEIMKGDVAMFDLGGNCAIQFDGVQVSPLMPPTAADDRLLFSEAVWGPLSPDATVDKSATRLELSCDSRNQGQLVILHMKQILDMISVDDTLSGCPRAEKIVRWFRHIIDSVREGTHPIYDSQQMDGTIDNVRANLDPDSCITTAIDMIGTNLISLLRGEMNISQVLQHEADFLQRMSRELLDNEILEQMASVVSQITFRYPCMRILEIGAGVGSATGTILDAVGPSYYSYTYTDTSPDSFDGTDKRFLKRSIDHSERFTYKVLDMTASPAEQGFDNHSYDLVVATNLLYPTVSLHDVLVRARMLLKPGGYFLLAACLNPDILAASFIHCGFEDWWLDESDGPNFGPMGTQEDWHKHLQAAGFSGVDSITPGHCSGPRPVSILVSQAVDEEVLRLRNPLEYTDQPKPNHGNLYIIGTTSSTAAHLIPELKAVLSKFFQSVVTAPTIDSCHTGQLAPMSSVLVLDVEKQLLKNMTEPQFDGLKLFMDTCHTVFWVSCGSESDEPHIGLVNGLLRSAAIENPHARYTHLNNVDLESLQSRIIAEELLRVRLVKSENDYALRKRVWSVEAELRVENGKTWIPRFKTEPEMNKRYMSGRRVIHDTADLRHSTVSMSESGALRAIEPAACVADDAVTQIHVRYSISAPLRFEGAGLLYLVVGVDSSTSARVLTLSSSRSSVVTAPSSWCRAIPSSIDTAREAHYLHDVELTLLAQSLLHQVGPNGTVVLYEPEEALHIAISTSAAILGLKLVLITTQQNSRSPASDSTIFVHKMTSEHELSRLLRPHVASAAVFLDAEPRDEGLGRRLQSLFPSSVRRENLQSLRKIPAKLSSRCDARSPTTAAVFLEDACCAALELVASPLMPMPKLVDVQRMQESEEPSDIIDWTRNREVVVRVYPSASTVLLSPSKTYLLVGMTGSLGRSVAEWMISRGVRYVVLTSRNPKVEQWWIDDMTSAGAKILALAMDVTDKESICKAHDTIVQQFPKIGGVVNGATVIRDAWLSNTTYTDWQDITKPKVQGSILLSDMYEGTDLDFFILMGSISGHMGNRSQAAYAAANSFMSSLIAQRRSRGLVGSIISPGPILSVGYVSNADAKLRGLLNEAMGCYNTSEQDLHELFAEAILAGQPAAGRNPDIIAGLKKASPKAQPGIKWYHNAKTWHFIDSHQDGGGDTLAPGTAAQVSLREQLSSAATTAESASIIETEFIRTVTRKLLLSDGTVSRETSLVELGVDSLIAVELRSWLAKEAGLLIPTLKILGDYSIAQLISESLPSK
ncbi:polyketide synthase, putative [Cordyceps militaris CM01]|uniref:Polyketide synthase, putative n=1 Tax=Cordyceps militaris (strain CM01) TaxID=983644 RepID=G3JSZ9_CORMM|nr:polyketide synthase, putative [Cordyceps militaris CM01]EGX88995.1 polyketide synthase, putative [Cordyceps militaris CM01]